MTTTASTSSTSYRPSIRSNASAQSVFDFVAKHLFKQGKPALGVKGHCVYRAPDGCMCAVGSLISDAKYQPWLENKTIWDEHVQEAVGQIGLRHKDMLGEMQHIHDSTPPEIWYRRLAGVAEDYKLKLDGLNEAYAASVLNPDFNAQALAA